MKMIEYSLECMTMQAPATERMIKVNAQARRTTPCDSDAERSEAWSVHEDVGQVNRVAARSTGAEPVAWRLTGARPVARPTASGKPGKNNRGGVA